MRLPPNGSASRSARPGTQRIPAGWRRIVGATYSLSLLPELNLLAFGFLLHLPWELWLSGSGADVGAHLRNSGELPLALSLAALVHAGVGVGAFWFIAVGARSRNWIRVADYGAVLMFALASVVFTLIVESLVIGVLTWWEHPAFLPTFVAPGLEFPSVLQAVVTPLLILAVVRRQLRLSGEERRA